MISSATKAESRFEKQRQLQLKLEQDQKELQVLEMSLTRTNVFSDKVVIYKFFRIQTGMLSSIDQRLSKLEGVIIPIHAATQKLTKVEERNNSCLKCRR